MVLVSLVVAACWHGIGSASTAADTLESAAFPKAQRQETASRVAGPDQCFVTDSDAGPANVEPGPCAMGCRSGCSHCDLDDSSLAACWPQLYGGADFLLVRAHFSEAIAFAKFTDSLVGGLPNEQSQAEELNFAYDPAFRAYLGYHLNRCTGMQFSYLHIDTSVAVNGSVGQANQFIIDPFGNRADVGQSIQTDAQVNLNAYDFDFVKSLDFGQACLGIRLAGGVRFADVRQSYGSQILAANANVLTSGTFDTHFLGVGPHLDLQAQVRRCSDSPLSLLARGGASFLVGSYDVESGVTITGVAGGGQSVSRTLTVPVLEAELGVVWQPSARFTAAAGWFVQTWSDLGTSGGTFGGRFVEADDANIMAFDGLFVRAMLQY